MMAKKSSYLLQTSAAALLAFSCLGPGATAQEQPSGTGETAGQGDGETDEIIVLGTRGTVINSVDAKRTSDSISDTLSADQADRFPDLNVAEALSRIPGVSFIRQNDTGNGQFISIRGLDSGLNTILNDGLRVGTADEFRRTPLDIITGGNISAIKVTKTPLPEDATEGIGGVVDIRTRGPLERGRNRYRLTGDWRNNSFDPRDGFRGAGDIRHKFSDNFGINLFGQFRRRYISNYQINPATVVPELLFAQEFTAPDGSPVIVTDEAPITTLPSGFIPIDQFNAEQVDYEFADVQRDNIQVSGSVEWRANDSTTFLFGGSLSRTESTETISNVEFDADNGVIASDGNGGFLPLTFPDPEIVFEGQIEDEIESQSRIFLRGQTVSDKWTFDYIGGWARGFEDVPILSIDFINDFDGVPGGTADTEVTFAPFILGGPFVSPNPQDLDVFLLALDPFCVDEDGDSCGEIQEFDEELEDSRTNTRWSGKFDATYQFEDSSFIDNIKFGLQYERSTFRDVRIAVTEQDESLGTDFSFLGNDVVDGMGDNNSDIFDFPPLLTGTLQSFAPIGSPFDSIGFTGIPLFDPVALRNLRDTFRTSFDNALENGISPGAAVPFDTDILTAQEDFFSAYVQSKLVFGNFELIGGVRVEYYDAEFSAPVDVEIELETEIIALDDDGNPIIDPQTGEPEIDTIDEDLNVTTGNVQFDNQADNFEVLPRFVLNYRPFENAILRFAYTTAIARPDFELLSGEIDGDLQIEVGLDGTVGLISNFEFGNPLLNNAYAQNFDISAEYYFNPQNAISIAAFYKRIDGFVFTSFASDDPLNNAVSIFDPEQLILGQTLTEDGVDFLQEAANNGVIPTPDLAGIVAVIGDEINVNAPINGNVADVYGIELGIFHTFNYLPGPLSNLGFIGNLTLQQTSIDIDLGPIKAAELDADGVIDDGDLVNALGLADPGSFISQEFSFFNSPEVVFNTALYYSSRNLDATLAYRFSGVQLEEVEAFGISQFQQGRGFLDFDIEYTFRDLPGSARRASVFFQANDLLDGGQRFSVFETRGQTDAFSDLATFNGRTFTVGARLTF